MNPQLQLINKVTMNLSKFIQSSDLLTSIKGKTPSELKSIVLDKGTQWYNENPEESRLIEKNLVELGFKVSDPLVENIKKHVILHYYEKLLPLCGGPEFYFDFIRKSMECQNACEQIRSSIGSGKGVLLAIAHFGAVEFIAPSLASYKLPLNVVLRFTSEHFSRIAHKQAEDLFNSGFFGPINFIEIGKPGTSTALEMAAALRRKEILISVFDEKTDYSKPVTLFGKKVYGGAGLDKLIHFSNAPVEVYTAFMIRGEENRYSLELNPVYQTDENILKQMYTNLQDMVGKAKEQWYFLHEEIPFVQ